MSHFTEVVLLATGATPQALAPFLEAIAAWELNECGSWPLQAIGADAPGEVAIAAGWLSRVPLEPYLAMLRRLPWHALGAEVQVAFQDEEDSRFRLHPLFPSRRAAPDPAVAAALAGLDAVLPPAHEPMGYWLFEPALDDAALDAAAIAYLAARGFTVTGGPAGPPAPPPGTT